MIQRLAAQKNSHPLAYSEEFFIHIEGEQKGPYTFPQLKGLYEKNLIPEETLYWKEGMEQLEPVSDLCKGRRRDRLRYLKQLRLSAIVLMVAGVLVTAYFAPVVKDGWREMNDRDATTDGAYWKARGFVREDVTRHDAKVAFEPFTAATITLTGTNAMVTLPGTLYGVDGKGKWTTWRVMMEYDGERKQWKLGK